MEILDFAGRRWTDDRGYLMGILNVTPDSFSDGGCYDKPEAALARAEKMIEEGADIIDVGGESTRPGYRMISDEEEIERVVPVIRAIKKRFDIPVSLDTYKSKVARAGLEAGADMINDIWGLRFDPQMAFTVAEYDVGVCLMHNRPKPEYQHFEEEVLGDLQKSIDCALEAGIRKERILLDPGVGFGKTYEQNLMILNHAEKLLSLGYPYLLGVSRKSVIGLTLNLPADQRLEGTLASTVLGRMKGGLIFRVHDVRANKRALMMTDAVRNSGVEAK